MAGVQHAARPGHACLLEREWRVCSSVRTAGQTLGCTKALRTSGHVPSQQNQGAMS
jgi:hypothetical protein